MNNQQIMTIQGRGNQLAQPSAPTSYKEYKEDYVATLIENLKSRKDINPGQVPIVTALGNIFSAKSITTMTTLNKEAW